MLKKFIWQKDKFLSKIVKYERHFTECWSRMEYCPVSDLKSPDQRKYLRSISDTRNSILRQNLNNKESWISDGMFLGCVKFIGWVDFSDAWYFFGYFSDAWFSRMISISEKNVLKIFSKIKISRILISLEFLGYVHHINISDGSLIWEEGSEKMRSENPI